jgi:uncharacterized membrane protein YhaH (DUF805 family)
MDNIISLFRSTEGRISRKSWWLGVVILIVINLIISLLVLPILGVSMMPNFAAMTPDATTDAAAVSQMVADSMRAGGWASLILFAIFAYPIYALSIKRRQDKDNNGMDLKIYLGLTGLVLLIQALGIGMETTTLGGVTIPTPSMWLMLLTFALGIFAIYLLVVLGFLRGTAGPNQYGPDPLGGTAPAAA